MNDNNETNPEFLWDSAKAYITGFAISYMTPRKKITIVEAKRIGSRFEKGSNGS